MQNLYRQLILWTAFLLTTNVYSQVTYLCTGELVNLQSASDYWGEPIWEYSTDSLNWQTVAELEQYSFAINASNSGYYRLRMLDQDCENSYISDVKHVVAYSDSFSIHSFFSDLQIPMDADPVFWYRSDDSLSQLKYYVNGNEILSDSFLHKIENPGVDFQIYATAISQYGCSLFTPVVNYTVYDSYINTNGDFQISGNFQLADVLISSSIDSTNLLTNSIFQITYTSSMGLDVLFATRPSMPVDQQLVGLNILYGANESFVMNNSNTALALVLMLYDVTNVARVYPQQVSDYVLNHPQFSNLVDIITQDLNNTGYVNLENENLWQISRSIGVDAVGELFPTLFSVCDVPDAPNLENNGSSLIYKHCGINTSYFARIYNHNNAPVSNPILFLGDGQTVFSNNVFNTIGNSLIYVFSNSSASALFLAYQARINDNIYLNDVNSSASFEELTIRLTNGNGLNNMFEDGTAESYNDFVFLWSFISSITTPKTIQKLFDGIDECTSSTIQSAIVLYNESVKQTDLSSPVDAAITIAGFASAVLSEYVNCGAQVFSKTFVGKFFQSVVDLIGPVSEAGFMSQFLYDWHTKEPKVKYIFTKTGNQWLGKLKIENNSDQTFYGIPGSLSYKEGQQPNPTFRFKESPLFATYEDGSTLYAAEYVDLSQSQMSGFNAFGISTSTQSVKFNNGETYQGLFFNNVSLSQAGTGITWRFSNSVPTPEVATLNVSFKYNNYVLPNYIEGLGESIGYSALVESPQLTIVSGNDQQGTADEILQNNCKISLTGSFGRPARDCPIRFEITQGGGKLKNTSPWEDNGETTTKLINTLGEDASDPEIGSASIRWRLGAQGDQKMKVTYKPAEIELTIIEFTAIVNNGNGNGNGSSTSVTDIDGNVYQAVQIGNQVWSKENLRTTKYSDGSIIPNVTSNAEWIVLNSGAWCNFENNPSYDSTYGKLYNYSAVADPRNICPSGWHVPTDAEWTVLTDYLGGLSIAGGKMKTTSFWQAPNTGATNESGFTGLPGGSRSSSVGGFGAWGTIGWWWSSSYAWYRALGYEYGYVNRFNGAAGYTRAGLSVRCLRD